MKIFKKMRNYLYYLYLLAKYKDKLRLANIVLTEIKAAHSPLLPQKVQINSKKIIILTTRHCIFIAHLLRRNLCYFFTEVDIIYEKPAEGFEDVLHFVICPNIFKSLPNQYIAYQMEQSINKRWFIPSYFEKLKNADTVIDYSRKNIKYLLDNGLDFKSTYYLPIGYFNDYMEHLGIQDNSIAEYDIAFYGDTRNDRRQKYIQAISAKFKTLIINEKFGEELINQLLKAKIVVNIHYYENALLETVRIFECLSLNRLVISEKSSDMQEYSALNQIVDFVETNNVDEMINRIEYWINNPEKIDLRINENKWILNNSPNEFDYYFNRLMLAKGAITYYQFYKMSSPSININNNFMCLSLPESYERRKNFEQDNKYGAKFFNGLRNDDGWIGCALSYKAMINKAKDLNLDYIIICEDDVKFHPTFLSRLNVIIEYLQLNQNKWDIFCGLIADLHEDSEILNIDTYKGEEFIYLNKFTSTVFNIYNRSAYNKILKWDENNKDAEHNTIDRYLEHANLRIITVLPYLVGHKEALHSTLWDASNLNYMSLISSSINLLRNKVSNFKSREISSLPENSPCQYLNF